jgi:hypothetical protein
MRVRAFIAAAIVAALTGPALAQQAPVPRYGEVDKEKSFNEKERDKEAERAYQRSLGNVPEKAPVDPWGNTRSAEAPKQPAKTAAKADAKAAPPKPKTKTGEAAK